MTFQKFVAWEKLPSLLSGPEPKESSSSSSKSGSLEEQEEKYEPTPPKDVNPKVDNTFVPFIEIPPSVKNVLKKIDTAQLDRAKKEVSKKLFHILDNVNRVYERYKKDDGLDPELEHQFLLTPTWEEKSRRSNLLDEISAILKESKFKGQELQLVLESLKAWKLEMTLGKTDILDDLPLS